jgi:Protein of unknown function (DUF2628)
MPTYTVHAPPPKEGARDADPERFVFVRDGFYVWAFLLAPLWLLLRRLWLVLVGYLVVNALMGMAFYATAAAEWVRALGGLLVALLVGFEAASLWRWTLARRRWRTLGFVVGDNEENAERRFFAEWTRRATAPVAPPPPPPEPQYTAPVRRGPPSGADVIGLFPEPGQ